MKINPAMIVLAREYRGLTQDELARRIFTSQAKVARIEGGVQTDLPDVTLDLIADTLDFPIRFFSQNEDLLGFGSSAYFYRKKADLTATDRKRIHGLVNLLRIHTKRFMTAVEIGAKRSLPKLDLDDYGGSAAKIAQAVRHFWSLPEGPVKNVTGLLESAGVVILPCDFGTRAMDATSMRLNEIPPLIFINRDVPGDRLRFTLCHELAHLIMHDVPHESMEDEANQFAAEFLMPSVEMKAQFSLRGKLRLVDFSNLKAYWKVSIAALVERAYDLEFLDDNQRKYLWMNISKLGYRLNEPGLVEKEEPKNLRKILDYFAWKLNYSAEELADFLLITLPVLRSLYDVSLAGVPEERKPRLHVVR